MTNKSIEEKLIVKNKLATYMTKFSLFIIQRFFSKLWIRSIITYIPFLLISIGLGYGIYKFNYIRYIDEVKQSELHTIEEARRDITKQLDIITSDIELLSNSDLLLDALTEDTNKTAFEYLVKFLSTFAENRKIYSQVRVITKEGMESIRLNVTSQKAHLVQEADLQDKSCRYYFKNAITLPRGYIYCSPIDLNIENNRIVYPLEPTLRVSMPVYGEKGKSALAVIVLNVNAQVLIKQLRDLKKHDSDFILLNRNGYYLHASVPSLLWGFQLENNKNQRFDLHYPDVWKQISTKRKGQMFVSNELFTFIKFDPTSEALLKYKYRINSGKNIKPSEKAEWIFVLKISENVLLSNIYEMKIIGIVVFITLSVLTCVFSFVISKSSLANKLSQEQLHHSETVYRLLVNHLPKSAIIGFDSNLTVTLAVGEAIYRIAGLSENIVGRPLDNIWNPEVCHTIKHFLLHVLEEKTYHFLEIELNGFFYELQTYPIPEESPDIPVVMCIFTDISKRKRLEDELRAAATVDELTQLINVRRLRERVEEHLMQAKRYEQPISLCMCDIDKFKSVNDTYGHSAGDEALRKFASLIRTELREPDFAGRYGGDEFCIVFPNTSLEYANRVLDRILNKVRKMEIYFKDEDNNMITLNITCSFGVAEFKSGMTDQELFDLADAALYRSKNAGRNRISS